MKSSTIFLKPTDKEELANIISSLKSNKAPAPDSILYITLFLLKNAKSKTQKPQKSRKTRKKFSEIFQSEFSILAIEQNQKLGIIFLRFLRFRSF